VELQKFSLSRRGRSLYHALTGIRRFFKTEHNAWLHLAATIGVLALAIIYRLNSMETVLLVFAMGFVWAAELFNTCIEKVMDFISTEKHPQIKLIKDMAAGAVLIAAITSLVIGLILFIPKIF
jgi:diacylglycerol kinase (ATP)